VIRLPAPDLPVCKLGRYALPTVAFRQVASEADVATVARLARDIWTEHYTPIIGRAQVDYMLEHFQSEDAIADQVAGDEAYYLILRDGEPVGYVAVVPDRGTASMFLSKIYVRRDLRGLGLGKAALKFAEERCRESGLRTLWLTVNKHNRRSIAWYKHMGFTTAGPTVKDIGGGFVMDDYKMVKDVDESPKAES